VNADVLTTTVADGIAVITLGSARRLLRLRGHACAGRHVALATVGCNDARAGPCPGQNSSGVPAAAAIRSRDDLQKVPVGVLEVDTTSPVVAIDFIGLGLPGISPVGELPVTDSTEDHRTLIH
jgi:hypothetical protein